MILELILALGLTVSTTTQPEVDCQSHYVEGCYYHSTKEIYINDKAKEPKETLIHEVGHGLLVGDDIAKTIARSKGMYSKPIYTTYILRGDDPEEEIMADLFVEYVMDRRKLSVERPCLVIYLDYKINNLTKI